MGSVWQPLLRFFAAVTGRRRSDRDPAACGGTMARGDLSRNYLKTSGSRYTILRALLAWGNWRIKGASVVVLITLVIGLLVDAPQQAFANVNVADDTHRYYDDCIFKFRQAGLDKQVDELDNSPFETKVIKKAGTITKAEDETAARNGQGTGSTIYWNPTDTGPIPGEGLDRDPCATLYHEMTHAYENAQGIKYNDNCITDDGTDWGIPIAEVHATYDENVYRDALSEVPGMQGLPQRTSYGGKPLPPVNQTCKTP